MTRTALYRHRDKNGTLLYVGISLSVAARLAQHASTSHWFAEVAQVDVEYFPTREAALSAERRAIHSEHPRCNQVHSAARQRKPETRGTRRASAALAFAPVGPVCTPRGVKPFGTVQTLREARTVLYREAVNLAVSAEPHRALYATVAARSPADTIMAEMGHRFWLRLTEDEFEACRRCVLADEAEFLLDYCEVVDEPEEWMQAAESLWSLFCLLTFKWSTNRDILDCRWPQLVAA